MPRLMRRIAALRLCPVLTAAAAAAAVGACATAAPPPPPPPPPPAEEVVLLSDWRARISEADRDRYDRRDEAWGQALQQARTQRGSGDLSALGDLIDPKAARPSVSPPLGAYRCRTVKLGSQTGEQGLGYVVYGWFACRIDKTPDGLKLTKLSGSQRPIGLFYPESDSQMVFLGTMNPATQAAPAAYGDGMGHDMVAVLERVGERRWRLVAPWPAYESLVDVLELVPTSRRP